jgi:hypothetical protein
VRNGHPQQQVLANLMEAKDAVDVASPAVPLQPLRNGLGFAPAFGDEIE